MPKVSTSYQPGESGNPAGRPKLTLAEKDLRTLARGHTEEVVERLLHWARSDYPNVSVSACEILLDRGWFKPRDDSAALAPNPGAETIDRPPRETYEEWMARRTKELEKLKAEITQTK